MRMFVIANQSSLSMAYKAFKGEDGNGDGKVRLLLGGNRDRPVDCMEEFVKYTALMRPYFNSCEYRFRERK